MPEDDAATAATEWLRLAAGDLAAAEATHGQGTALPRHVCWLAQQAAEKAIKAVLVHEQIDFPRSHDLEQLSSLVPEGWAVRNAQLDLATLSPWAVEGRYPGTAEASAADAEEAFEIARQVITIVADQLGGR